MSLEIVQQDLFSVEADTIVVTINLCGAMGAGVAKTARDTIPGLYKHYKKMYPTLDPTQFILYQHEGVKYLLVPTKLDWRNPSPRDLVIHNFNKLVNLVNRHPDKFKTIALPPMGCGNGGLSFEDDIRYVYLSMLPFVEANYICATGAPTQ